MISEFVFRADKYEHLNIHFAVRPSTYALQSVEFEVPTRLINKQLITWTASAATLLSLNIGGEFVACRERNRTLAKRF